MGEFVSKPTSTGRVHSCSLPNSDYGIYSGRGKPWWVDEYAYAADARGTRYACDCGREYKWLPYFQGSGSYKWTLVKDDISKRQLAAYEQGREDLTEVSNNTRKSRGFWDFLFKGE